MKMLTIGKNAPTILTKPASKPHDKQSEPNSDFSKIDQICIIINFFFLFFQVNKYTFISKYHLIKWQELNKIDTRQKNKLFHQEQKHHCFHHRIVTMFLRTRGEDAFVKMVSDIPESAAKGIT